MLDLTKPLQTRDGHKGPCVCHITGPMCVDCGAPATDYLVKGKPTLCSDCAPWDEGLPTSWQVGMAAMRAERDAR